jgi:hypothetical protein
MIPGSANPLLLATAAGAGGGYEIERSLRFNSSDSAYLSRTPASAGNRKTWTWAGWVKIGGLTGIQNLLSDMNAANSSGLYAVIASDRTFFFQEYSLSGGAGVNSLALFRDPGAWYHLVIAYDTTQATASNRFKLYVNGVQATIAGSYPNQNLDGFWNRATYSTIGNQGAVNGNYFDGYLADIHFIDGQALDPSSFGEFDTNGVWQPIDASGLTYGTNGFHLPFSDNSTAAALGTDTSGNGNTWTVNNIAPGPVSSTVVGMAWSSTLDTLPDWSSFPSLTTIDTYSLTNPASFTINSFSGVGSNPFFGYWWSSDGVSWTRSSSNGVSPPYTTATVNRYLRLSLAGSSIVTSATAGTETFTSAFVDADSLVDSPTNYGTDTGAGGEVRGNYATLNPVVGGTNIGGITFANGNLEATWNAAGGYAVTLGTIGVSSGKWYWETTIAGLSDAWLFGIATAEASLTDYIGSQSVSIGYYSLTGVTYRSAATTTYGSSYTTNDVIGVALDLDNGKVFFSKNGTWQNSGSPTAGTNAAYTGLSGTFFPAYAEGTSLAATAYICNFGQRPFAYTAPSGFKALCTTNLPEPTIADGSTAMDVALYTGNGSTQTISGLGFSPDFVWIKERSSTSSHQLYDTVRGATNTLYSNLTTKSRYNADGLDISFTSTGFN